MATLYNTRIADTYQGLLKTLDTAVIGGSLTQISDGSGNGTGVFLNNAGDLEATGIVSFGSLKDIGENITILKFVDAADGLINNDNDTTIPTSAAIIDYVAGQITLSDLDFSGDGGTTGSVDLDSQTFSVLGTSNEITTSGSGQTLTIGLPSSVIISGTLTATTFSGDLNGTINTATTAVTQPLGDNSTKVATTAFVDRVITAQDLDFQGTTGSGSVDLDSETFIIQGTTNEITTAATGQVLTVGLPSSITTDLVGNVTGNVTGNVVGNVTGDLTGNADTATAWATGRTITLTGEATGVTPSIDGTTNVSAALTLINSAVIGKVLTGLQSPAGATILATDSMLIAFGKLQSQINGIAEGLQFQGSWNATTNTPTLTSSVGTQGFYYIVNVAGSTNLNGITDWEVGDWAIFSTTGVWQRLDQTGVQGTGTTGNLTKWATGSTISDSIVSESGVNLTVTGSLTTTTDTNVGGNFVTNGSVTVLGDTILNLNASINGTLTTASPVINTGISGSAVLDDDTFATASATTVATSESIKAYVDNNTGSGTAGTIPKFATGGESLEDSIITEASSAITVGGAVTSKDLTVIDTYANDPLIKLATNTSSNVEVEMRTATTSYNAGIGVVTSGYDFNIFTENTPKLTITSGGDATFSKEIFIGGSGYTTNPPTTKIGMYTSTRAYIQQVSGGSLEFWSSAALPLVTISSGGAVGINNSSPDSFSGSGSTSSSLVIGQGTSGISPQLTLWQGNSAQASINFASSNSGTGQYEGRIRYTRDTGVMDFRVNSNDALTISSGGTITVNASTNTTPNFSLESNGTQLGYLGTADSLANAPTTSTQMVMRSEVDMAFCTGGGTRRLIISSGGNVIVGHTSSVGTAYQPNIQVKGDSASNYGALGVISSNNEMLGVVGVWSNGENSLMIAADPDNLRPSSSIVFTNDGAEKMRISSGYTVEALDGSWATMFDIATKLPTGSSATVTVSNIDGDGYGMATLNIMRDRVGNVSFAQIGTQPVAEYFNFQLSGTNMQIRPVISSGNTWTVQGNVVIITS